MKLKKPRPIFKSIFAKYFAVFAVLIAVCITLTAMVQVVFARRYWIEDKRESLAEQSQSVAAMIRENTHQVMPEHYYVSEELHPLLVRMAEATDINVLITDTDYRVVLCSHLACGHSGKVLPESIKSGLQSDNFFTVSTVGGLYDEGQYTTGVTLTTFGRMTGYAVVSSSAAELGTYVMDNLRMYLLSAVVVLILAFIALYAMTYQMVRPLRQMAVLTRQFSNGDFSGRVQVRGNDEVAELAQALNSMAVSLSSVEDMRRSFVANVSHDLKTPMTTIAGFIDGILDGTIPADRRHEYLRIVSDETKRLSRLVTTMLDLSRIDSGQLQIRPVTFDLTAMVCSTLLSFEQRIEKKNIRIEGLEDCEPRFVHGDHDLLQQVVYNLLDNAVKFTEEGGAIRLLLADANGWTVCSVRNTGEGIPAAEMPHIFERFYKSDRSRGLDKTGTGLGLYIVKTLVDLHGGEITVRSAEGQFCEFTFRLRNS